MDIYLFSTPMSNKQLTNEILKDTIYNIIENMNYLERNLTMYAGILYGKNYKTLLRNILKDLII